MKIILNSILCCFLCFCLKAQSNCDPCTVHFQNDSTYYPTDTINDYQPQKVFAKVGFPDGSGKARIWVKGNSEFSKVWIPGLNGSSDTIVLSPPYYTSVIFDTSKREFTDVHFLNDQLELKHLQVQNFKEIDLRPSDNKYSILFYGCFQPFTVDQQRRPAILQNESKANLRMREVFKRMGLSQPVQYVHRRRVDKNPKNFELIGEYKGPILAPSKLIIGTGDQIYVDAGYKFKGEEGESEYKKHPLSAWAYNCCDPKPLLSPSNYTKHLDRTYSAFHSFSTLDTLFRTIPSINVWDDHEIRDGWGSHGDEYDTLGKLNPDLKKYFESSKDAYIAHQWTVGANGSTTGDLSQQFLMNDFHIFTLDLRTQRNINKMQVLNSIQLEKFKDWAAEIPDNERALIISSIPFFYGNTKFSERMAETITQGEITDDIRDSWSYNEKDRNKLLKVIVNMRNRGIKPIIVSGDVHVGAMTEVWYEPLNKDTIRTDASKILCYEIIASGLSHESLGEKQGGFQRMLRDKSEKQRWSDPTIVIPEIQSQLYPSTRLSRPDLNFGALEITGNKQFLHLFTTKMEGENTDVIQNTIEINWKKTYAEYKELSQTSLKQFFFNFFSRGKPFYTPPTVESKKVIQNSLK